MVTRCYFPSAGTAPASPAFASGWESTGGGNPTNQIRPLVTAPSNSVLTGTGHVPPAVTAPVDTSHCQYTSAPLPAGAITGTFTLVIAASQNGISLDGFLQAIIRVVSGDGSTVRGTLYAGNTATAASATTTSPAYEFPSAAFLSEGPSLTRVLTGTLTSVTALSGDRIVVEFGSRSIFPNGSSRNATLVVGDPTSLADFAATVNLAGDTGRPWIEFSQDLFAIPPLMDAGRRAVVQVKHTDGTWKNVTPKG